MKNTKAKIIKKLKEVEELLEKDPNILDLNSTDALFALSYFLGAAEELVENLQETN